VPGIQFSALVPNFNKLFLPGSMQVYFSCPGQQLSDKITIASRGIGGRLELTSQSLQLNRQILGSTKKW
jgi:hypothetical protein